MKKIFFPAIAVLFLALGAMFSVIPLAGAQTYPYTSPVYTPNAIDPTVTLTAPGVNVMVLNNIGTVTLRVTGTCTSLAATVQATNDGTNWTAINLYPIATGTTAPTAVASISAVGFWKINTAGYSQIRLNATALTASCTVTMVGTPGGFNGTQF